MKMSISRVELYEAIQRVGAARAAAQGAFHDLPSGGGSGDSNVRMLRASSNPLVGNTTSIINFVNPLSVPFTDVPFLSTSVLNPVLNYQYDISLWSVNIATQTLSFMLRWFYVGSGDDPMTGGDVDIGLRVEPFVLSE